MFVQRDLSFRDSFHSEASGPMTGHDKTHVYRVFSLPCTNNRLFVVSAGKRILELRKRWKKGNAVFAKRDGRWIEKKQLVPVHHRAADDSVNLICRGRRGCCTTVRARHRMRFTVKSPFFASVIVKTRTINFCELYGFKYHLLPNHNDWYNVATTSSDCLFGLLVYFLKLLEG